MKIVNFVEMMRIGSYVRAMTTFACLVFLVLELLGQFVMLVRGLVEQVLECDDLPGVFEHVFLHFVQNYILNRC